MLVRLCAQRMWIAASYLTPVFNGRLDGWLASTRPAVQHLHGAGNSVNQVRSHRLQSSVQYASTTTEQIQLQATLDPTSGTLKLLSVSTVVNKVCGSGDLFYIRVGQCQVQCTVT